MHSTVPHSVSQEFRKFTRNCNQLKRILEDTQKALDNIKNNLILEKDIKEQLVHQEAIPTLRSILDCNPNFVVFGQSCHAKAIFINKILSNSILPLHSSMWRWVRFSFGYVKETRLMLGFEFEIVEKVHVNEKPWTTIPESDLQRTLQELSLDQRPTLEVKLNNTFLRDNVNLLLPPDCSYQELADVLSKTPENILPIILYIITEDILSESYIQEIRKIKDFYQDVPILFINFSKSDIPESLTESERDLLEQQKEETVTEGSAANSNYYLRDQLLRLGFLNENETPNSNESPVRKPFCIECAVDNFLISDHEISDKFVTFVHSVLKSYLLKMANMLSEIHNNFIRSFILTAFDMAREIQITPRRISYAQQSEGELYKTLMKIAGEKQEEIARIIHMTLQDMRSNVAEVLEGYNQKDSVYQNSVKMASLEIQQMVLRKLSRSVAKQLVQSVGCLHESFTGTLQRCLENLEKKCNDHEGNLLASDAVKQIITAAYNIELKSSSSFSVVVSFMDRLRKFIQSFQMPWSSCSQPQCGFQWQLQVASDVIDSLSASRLAKSISYQFQEHVKSSHNAFHSAMRSLENQLSGKLERTEEQRIAIRKHYAPRFARLALDSTSLCDCVRYGMPKQMREIGRGQYGVVYSSEPWGGVNPCAVKSVVPPDDRHWNDLAMEFYYTRTIPEHPRIVKLRGSVIDHQYGGGCSPAVLLVMERMTKDLYCGLKAGLSWSKRLQIAIDVVEGIRYLHSQGLVHRDIKLKNVLLDTEDRAKLTDFGFCIPEAMMSGSIVGTPVHMAPELLSGQYDSSVDVYAFGVLFWYICANRVRLPCVFEQFQNKEQLWGSVKKGVRPECLPHFSEECWQLMEQCWAAEPSQRPLLGYVQPQLEAIRDKSLTSSGQDSNG